MKKVIIIISIVFVLAISGGVFYYYLPINVIERAFDRKDYETVVEQYGKLRNGDDIEHVKDRLLDIAENYYKEYYAEKKKYNDVKEYFDLVSKSVLKKNRVMVNYQKNLDEIKNSREAFEDAESLMDDGKYLDAIEMFNQVSDIDKKYKEDADNNIEKCQIEYIKSILSDADELAANEEYESAREILLAALEKFPEDETLMVKLDEINMLDKSHSQMEYDISGRWKVMCDMGDVIADELGVSGYDISFPLEVVFYITEDTIETSISKDSIKVALDYLTSNHMDAVYDVAKKYGINPSEADLLIKITYKGSYTDFIMDNFGDDIDDALKTYCKSYNYTIDDKRIYFGTSDSYEYITYTKTDNKIQLEEYVGSYAMWKIYSYPLVLEK